MISSAVWSRFVSPPDPHDMYSEYLLQVLHFGPHSDFYVSWYEHGYARLVYLLRSFLIQYLRTIYISMLYSDTSMGMPASSILSDDPSSIIEVMYFFSPCRWFEIGVLDFSCFLLLSIPTTQTKKWLMMSIGHTMSSCPRTSGGNLLTPKNG